MKCFSLWVTCKDGGSGSRTFFSFTSLLIRIFPASMGVISAMTGNPPEGYFSFNDFWHSDASLAWRSKAPTSFYPLKKAATLVMVIIPLNFARCTLPTHRNRQVKSSLKRSPRCPGGALPAVDLRDRFSYWCCGGIFHKNIWPTLENRLSSVIESSSSFIRSSGETSRFERSFVPAKRTISRCWLLYLLIWVDKIPFLSTYKQVNS